MSSDSSYSLESEVIAIEDDDDDDDDVEVVFSNLNKTHVYRNLIYKKISQEIELLRAMCKHTVPNEFNQFKELAKRLGFQNGDDVIHSAWQRVLRKHLEKSSNLQCNKTSKISLVELPQRSVDKSLPLPTSPHSVNQVASPSPLVLSSSPTTSEAVPIALLRNQSVHKLTVKPQTLVRTLGTHANNESGQSSKVNSTEQSVGGEQVFSNKRRSRKRKSEMDIVDLEHDKLSLAKSGTEESDSAQFSVGNDLFQKYLESLIPGQNLSSAKVTEKPAKKLKSSSKQVVSVDLPKTVDQVVVKSHIGVRAKIVRRKQTSPTNCRNKLSRNVKEMSAAELKEFKAEQKILKYKQRREFEIQQLQKVHDRLVDVLIPKYYTKDSNENS